MGTGKSPYVRVTNYLHFNKIIYVHTITLLSQAITRMHAGVLYTITIRTNKYDNRVCPTHIINIHTTYPIYYMGRPGM